MKPTKDKTYSVDGVEYDLEKESVIPKEFSNIDWDLCVLEYPNKTKRLLSTETKITHIATFLEEKIRCLKLPSSFSLGDMIIQSQNSTNFNFSLPSVEVEDE